MIPDVHVILVTPPMLTINKGNLLPQMNLGFSLCATRLYSSFLWKIGVRGAPSPAFFKSFCLKLYTTVFFVSFERSFP